MLLRLCCCCAAEKTAACRLLLLLCVAEEAAACCAGSSATAEKSTASLPLLLVLLLVLRVAEQASRLTCLLCGGAAKETASLCRLGGATGQVMLASDQIHSFAILRRRPRHSTYLALAEVVLMLRPRPPGLNMVPAGPSGLSLGERIVSGPGR